MAQTDSPRQGAKVVHQDSAGTTYILTDDRGNEVAIFVNGQSQPFTPPTYTPDTVSAESSLTAVVYPIISATKASEKILGPNRQWLPSEKKDVKEKQRLFIKKLFEPCREEVDKIPEIVSIASWDANEINKFTKERGFNLELKPFEPNQFGTASVLDLLVEWIEVGFVREIKTDDSMVFPAVLIDEYNVDFYYSKGHKNPIACLKTKTGDLVYMTMFDKRPVPSDFDLITTAKKLSSRERSCENEWKSLFFPMVDLNQHVDVSWLVGLNTTDEMGKPDIIVKALQQTKLRMNEVGARAQSAVVETHVKLGGLSLHKPDHIIKRPFLVWIERPGLTNPLFVGFIARRDWKNPGDITK